MKAVQPQMTALRERFKDDRPSSNRNYGAVQAGEN